MKECNENVTLSLKKAAEANKLKEFYQKNLRIVKRIVPSLEGQITEVYNAVKDGIVLLHMDHLKIMDDLEEIKKEIKELKEDL